MKKLLFLLLITPSAEAQNLQAYGEALAKANPYLFGYQQHEPKEKVLVPVPSYRWNVLSGYEPSTALIEMRGRQLNTPLSTALGFDQMPQQMPVIQYRGVR